MGLVSITILICMDFAHAQYRPRVSYRKNHTCETGSCYPATGNLLIGRESQLYASSTCGLHKQERYCIVAHLQENNKKKCFWCDSRVHARDRRNSHNVSNIVDIGDIHSREVDPWWQSENGVENVYIQLDMEAEFHFTHLVIQFKTFRPAAAIIERSQDKGRTWQVYQYFAHDCAKEFRNVTYGVTKKLSDVVCDSRYSQVYPSYGGELIFRVIPPNIPVDDPFAAEVQELVKMTNLRINFTKLHTLGDNLLDEREEIQEKYYYAINHMIVRGSCSCYGHANRCLPLPEKSTSYYPLDMVHGQCECTHNTKGLNCNECEDFYNDLPWKPAFGKSQNACKRCNCNKHATKCHFDWAVYELSGNVTGGVCDECLHNTQGKNCEECRPFFYHDLQYDIEHPNACQSCDCDPRGSVDDGVCDSHTDPVNGLIAGKCHCKTNVDGRRCDQCKEGYWNFSENSPEGCQSCSCNILGTVDNQGCNVFTGECTCKRYVTGRDCNQCAPKYWGLSDERDGCKACNCDPGGSYDNDCDVITGQCKCRPHVVGRACDQPEQSYFTGFPDFMVYDAELSNNNQDVEVVVLEPNRDGRENTWTGTGYLRAFEKSFIEFIINDIQAPLDYDIVIRYSPQFPRGWENVNVKVEHFDPVDPNGPCANKPIGLDRDVALPVDARSAVVRPSVCLEPGKTYKITLDFKKYGPDPEIVSASVLVDSIVLFPNIEALPILRPDNVDEFKRYRCDEMFHEPSHGQISKVCLNMLQSIGAFVYQGSFRCDCDPTGSKSFECSSLGGQCECKANVVGRQCNTCAPGTYGFGPEGCLACDCNSLALDNFCDAQSGQCKCRANTYGRVCDECQIGFWNFPNCQRCECNGHAQTCDSKTGVCIACGDFTEGQHCETCLEGFYGAPQLGTDIPCRPCPCPETIESGHSYADSCILDPYNQDVMCACKEGYAGARCDKCADNYYGDPEEPGGSCNPCDCNNNVDISRPGNCDAKTGQCLQCLYNTEGDHCETCKERFYGDAINQQCAECVCSLLGANQSQEYCNRTTGQCPCLPNVVGLECNECKQNHWKIASGNGCEPCDCDSVGSHSQQCNPFDGQCDCRPGFGSRRCDQCQHNHWGNPNEQCHKCDCDIIGSQTSQCNRNNGTCVCVEGIGGDRCNQCARGYLGNAPNCSFCGECFKNWDDILSNLHDETNKLISFAARIKEVGVLGAYTFEFNNMEKSIQDVQSMLNNTVVSEDGLREIQAKVSALRAAVKEQAERVENTTKHLEDTERNVQRTDLILDELQGQVNELERAAEELKENATRLQEANVEGALNLTRKAQKDSAIAESLAVGAAENIIVDAERNCKRALAWYNRSKEEVDQVRTDNERKIVGLQEKLTTLNSSVPELNEKVCGKSVLHCDETCGGAGCDTCGGISCDLGAVTKANTSLELVRKADKTIKEKEAKAEELHRTVSQAKLESMAAKNATEFAFDKADAARNRSGDAIKKSMAFAKRLDLFLKTVGALPSEIRYLAEGTKKMNINTGSEQVRTLALKISNAVNQLTNINTIIAETDVEKRNAGIIKDEAVEAKVEAENIIKVLQNVTEALDEASKAQDLADESITRARKDIAAAETDLTQISSESNEAHAEANETLNSVETLNGRVGVVKSLFFKNALDAAEVQKEISAIESEAQLTERSLDELKMSYEDAAGKLHEKDERRQSAKEKAKRLSQRAAQLYVVTNRKEKDLKDLENSYAEKDKTLHDLSKEMEELSRKMEEYVENISGRSKYYSECIA